jgi:hypothetical protein
MEQAVSQKVAVCASNMEQAVSQKVAACASNIEEEAHSTPLT